MDALKQDNDTRMNHTATTMEEQLKTTAELVVESVSMPTIVMPEPNLSTAPVDPMMTTAHIANGTAHPPQAHVLTTPEEFQDDVMNRLGRANGNVYWRKPGVEGVHDGQIMVRLKKKRFIVIDYGIDPDKLNVSLSSITSSTNVMIPPGAGRDKCASSDCTKVGIPVLLYDSNPEEPLSLYLRSGLCFTCQRQLNEKRRTQRKRKSDDHSSATAAGALLASTTGGNLRKDISPGGAIVMPNMMYGCKKYRTTNEPETIMTLSPSAIIIEPALICTDVVKGPEYGMHEMITDVKSEIKTGLTNHVDLLLHSLTNKTNATQAQPTNASSSNPNDAAIEAAAAIAASALAAHDETSAATTAAAIAAASASTTMEEASAAAAAIAANTSMELHEQPALGNQESVYETLLHYENAMSSIKKCVYLLTRFNAAFVGSTTVLNQVHNNAVPTPATNMNVLLNAATDVKDTNNIAASVVKAEDNFTSANIAGADMNGMNVADV